MFKYIIFIICSVIFSFNIAYAKCNFNTLNYIDELSDIAQVKKIYVKNNNYKKWASNNLKIISNPPTILKKFKKNFNGRVKIVYSFGECEYQAKIKQHGNDRDHINFSNGQIVQSLKIKIKDGNIANIVRFILFLKETRYSENEVYSTLLLSELGFLSPRTKILTVNQNGVDVEMILQEEKVKEFLEYNSKKEGPIFRGDEKLVYEHKEKFKLENISLSSMKNHEWASINNENLTVALSAYNKLQLEYLNYADSIRFNKHPSIRSSNITINNSEKNKYFSSNFSDFEFLLIALNATHGLRPHNRNLYWNSYEALFEPIYYDGNAKPLMSLENGFINYLDAYFLKKKFNYQNINELIKSINLISKNKFINKFSTLSNFSMEESTKYIEAANDQIIKNLLSIENMLNNFTYENKDLDFKSSTDKKIKRYIDRYSNTFGDVDFLYPLKVQNKKIEIKCINENVCANKNITLSNARHLLSGDNINTVRSVLLPNIEEIDQNYFDITKLNNLSIIHSLDSNVILSGKNLILKQNKKNDWFLFLNQEISNLNIKFIGINSENSEKYSQYPHNLNGLIFTGCVNFVNSSLKNLNFAMSNGVCEDTLNIVSSSGEINLLNVDAAFSDAVDLDFSNINIKNLVVKNAKNDCIDLSAGKYFIDNANLVFCGDKGVSAGEKSYVKLNNVIIKDSNIGIASKDSSVVDISKVDIDNSQTCVAAYNKKQEFLGAILNISKFNCKNFDIKINKDNSSRLKINDF